MVSDKKIGLYCVRAGESIQKIQSICDSNIEIFVSKKNWVNQSACIMQLINLIELVKKITTLHPTLRQEREVSKMRGLRNIAAHDYMAIDMYIIHDVVKNYLPGLQNSIEKFTRENGAK